MNRRRRQQPISNINIVPYLDVLLVLLVIFMITTPLFNQGVIDLPSVGDTPLPQAQEASLEILYDDAPSNPYRLLDHATSDETSRLSLEELLNELDKKRVLYPQAPIVISAAGKLPYERVIELVGALRERNFAPLALSAEIGGKR